MNEESGLRKYSRYEQLHTPEGYVIVPDALLPIRLRATRTATFRVFTGLLLAAVTVLFIVSEPGVAATVTAMLVSVYSLLVLSALGLKSLYVRGVVNETVRAHAQGVLSASDEDTADSESHDSDDVGNAVTMSSDDVVSTGSQLLKMQSSLSDAIDENLRSAFNLVSDDADGSTAPPFSFVESMSARDVGIVQELYVKALEREATVRVNRLRRAKKQGRPEASSARSLNSTGSVSSYEARLARETEKALVELMRE